MVLHRLVKELSCTKHEHVCILTTGMPRKNFYIGETALVGLMRILKATGLGLSATIDRWIKAETPVLPKEKDGG